MELGVLLWNQLELLYSLRKEIGAGPPGDPFIVKILLFILRIFLKNQNDVKFDFCIGHAHVLFCFLWIIKIKQKGEPCNPWIITKYPKLVTPKIDI